MKTYRKKLLLILIILLFGVAIIYVINGNNNDVPATTESNTLNCRDFCRGFISCAQTLNPESSKNIAKNKMIFYKNACFIGCKKQQILISKCSTLVKHARCSEAVTCFQNILQPSLK